MTDDVEVFLDVGISVGEVGPETHSRQMVFRGFVQERCQGVGLGLAPGGEAAPAPGIEPVPAEGCEPFPDQEGEVAVVCVFAEAAVRAPLAGGVMAMAGVKKDGNNYFREIPLSL